MLFWSVTETLGKGNCKLCLEDAEELKTMPLWGKEKEKIYRGHKVSIRQAEKWNPPGQKASLPFLKLPSQKE